MSKRQPKPKMTFESECKIEGVITSCGGVLAAEPALVLILRPWRKLDGAVQRNELRVEVPVKDEAALQRSMGKWREGSIALSVRTVRRATKLYMEKIVAQSRLRRVDGSPELRQLSEQQAKPQFAKGAILGPLELEREFQWYQTTRRHRRTTYTVIVDSADPDDSRGVANEVVRAERIVVRLEQALPRLRDAIANALLDTYNDSWRQNGRSLSATGFSRRHKLQSVQIGASGVTVHFQNGGLFTDHVVEIRLTPRLRIEEVLIA